MFSIVDVPFDIHTVQLIEDFNVKISTDRIDDFENLIKDVKRICKPKAMVKASFIESKGKDTVDFDGRTFTSRILRKNLDSIERVFPFIVTCGTEIDDVEIDPDDSEKLMWMNYLKGALIKSGIQYLTAHITAKYKIPKLSYMGPGQGDSSVWPHEQIINLYSIFDNAEKRIGVRLTESLLLIPLASAVAIFFPTEVDFNACQLCHNETCDFRKAPFDSELWESIEKRKVAHNRLWE